ncbi:biotin-independent malonate decarboxylase subunit beta [Rhizosaccharibacter radicis]|uniref:Biotin-independent malonate decarboxylase subunit beta n=1 Tax=Rhizosaccharibacter radicis TaxID=2782605 RepID=A0ABT1W1I7_9PROT|nr:biotin-independent malonate decarboxylase subunit beta [Acetobacteraceae bacterium KSS12]
MSARVPERGSWLEASARARVAGLLDANSFTEFLGPEQREMSPHLSLFDLPRAFDDGVVVGRGKLGGRPVFVAAQDGRFMGGTFGEISGSKIVGLLRAARDGAAGDDAPRTVLLLLDTGGVRLQEANAGELAVSEIIRAIAEARRAGITVIALVGGKAGAFGGGGIITACCSRIVVSRHGRISVSGPEVIETNQGIEEFDSKDRALVWRITGGRTRWLTGGADRYVADEIRAFREAAMALGAEDAAPFDLFRLQAEQSRLEQRLQVDGDSRDATQIWTRRGLDEPERVGDMTEHDFVVLADREAPNHDAR